MRDKLTREEKLRLMYSSDSSGDGIFITGVVTTGIYCLPSCTARKPNAENVKFFSSEHEAQGAGLRPCKRCKPDQFYAGVDPEKENLLSMVDQMQMHPGMVRGISDMAEMAKIGQSKLYHLVQRYFKTTPGELIHLCRIEKGEELLRNSEMSITAIAFDVGYESLSAFYERFKKKTGMTPNAFREVGLSDR